ncbi:MAG: hypothetical protein K8R68_01960 [Bacteroidales bacterium]|nr:hypothetical protein [Bacteroidales bacterium]
MNICPSCMEEVREYEELCPKCGWKFTKNRFSKDENETTSHKNNQFRIEVNEEVSSDKILTKNNEKTRSEREKPAFQQGKQTFSEDSQSLSKNQF